MEIIKFVKKSSVDIYDFLNECINIDAMNNEVKL